MWVSAFEKSMKNRHASEKTSSVEKSLIIISSKLPKDKNKLKAQFWYAKS